MLRALVVTVFVVVWMVLGFTLHLGDESYLVLGIPLTVLFQRFIAKKPIRALWVRRSSPQRWSALTIVSIVLLALTAILQIVGGVAQKNVGVILIGVAAMAGSFAAGYALAQLDREALRRGWLPMVIALVIGTVYMAVQADHAPRMIIAAFELVALVANTFAVEEVTFRGALDSYMSEGWPHWSSTLVTALLWGPWHIPLMARDEMTVPNLAGIVAVHTALGVPLALAWRRSGNLWLPAFAHAFIDAVRDSMNG